MDSKKMLLNINILELMLLFKIYQELMDGIMDLLQLEVKYSKEIQLLNKLLEWHFDVYKFIFYYAFFYNNIFYSFIIIIY